MRLHHKMNRCLLPPNYPGMEMLADEQATFVAKYLKPLFNDNNIRTKY